MNKSSMILRPIHYACVSGGKDSLYMLKLILENPQKYPLEMVVHYELEIDHGFVKNVVNEMEKMCDEIGVKFVRIKPRKSWCELYQKYNAPTRVLRWCNSRYKLDCVRQLKDWIRSQNCRPVAYLGICADEKKRFKYEIGDWEYSDICYPLAEEGIVESKILEWARDIPLFEGWYKIFRRQGCWLCPCTTRLELAWLLKHEPIKYEFFYKIAKEYEKTLGRPYWGNDTMDKIDRVVRNKYLPILDYKESEKTEIEMMIDRMQEAQDENYY